jgi:hypothetical protein
MSVVYLFKVIIGDQYEVWRISANRRDVVLIECMIDRNCGVHVM